MEGDLAGRLAGHGHDLDVARDARGARHRPVGARLQPVGIGLVGANGQPVAVAKAAAARLWFRFVSHTPANGSSRSTVSQPSAPGSGGSIPSSVLTRSR